MGCATGISHKLERGQLLLKYRENTANCTILSCPTGHIVLFITSSLSQALVIIFVQPLKKK